MEAHLFSPITLGQVALTNRIVVSPMCQYSAQDGSATKWHLQHIMQLGYSGASLIMVEATAVERIGRITPYCLGLYSDENESTLKQVINSAKAHSLHAHFGIQLAHSGRKGSCTPPWEGGEALKEEDGAWQTVAPSPLAFDGKKSQPQELTIQKIEEIISLFAKAAKRAARCGFSVVELHSAHGYLLHQFLSPLSNKRTDHFGGSLENRMRFPLAVQEAVKKALPPSIALGLRICGTDWVEGGMTLDEAVIYSKELKKRGADYVCVSSGGVIPKVTVPVGPGYQVHLAEKIKKEAAITTRAVGMIDTPHFADQIIRKEQADLVALARPFLDDPRWGWHAARVLGGDVPYPSQYDRVSPKLWKSPIRFEER